MFSYLAFKGLYWDRNLLTLSSPVIRTAWSKKMTPWGELFYLKTNPDQLDRGKGIFGASLEEAWCYGQPIYLVAPDPRYRLILGTLGWRAEAAMVVAPLATREDAAARIIAAHRAGYPQVPGILAWAARYVQPEEGCRVLQDILRDWQNEDTLQVVVDSAAAIGKYGVPILEELSYNENASVRLKVLDVCKRPAEYVRPLLQRFIESDDEIMRAYAASACSAHGVGALPLLEKLAHDDSCEVRVAVAKSIRRLGKVAIPILEELRHDKEKHVRLEALKSLRPSRKALRKR
jgi:hypothetical protein